MSGKIDAIGQDNDTKKLGGLLNYNAQASFGASGYAGPNIGNLLGSGTVNPPSETASTSRN